MLPGTNREFYKFWRYAVERKYRLTTRIPMNQGDIVLRMSTLWHRGMPNRSDVPRPMMAVTFGEIDDPAADPFAVNDGEIEFYPNWYNTSRLGQLRERTFVAAADQLLGVPLRALAVRQQGLRVVLTRPRVAERRGCGALRVGR